MKNNATRLSALLILSSLAYLISVLYLNRSLFLSRFNPKQIQRLYEQSQWQQSQNIAPLKILDTWAMEHKYTGWKNFVDENMNRLDTEKVKSEIIRAVRSKGISDAQLYSYAGYKYIQGTDPTLLNPEHPPLGKYLIGLSILLFQNENIILVLSGILVLVLVFSIVYTQTGHLLPASIALFLTATQTLFIDQLVHGPQLEIFQLLFFLLMLFLLQLYDKKAGFILIFLGGVSFGLLLSVKTAATHFPIFFIWLMALIPISKRFRIKEFIAIHGVGITTFVFTYAVYFLHGNSLRKWLGVQKYIVLFYKQSGINIGAFAGNYLRLIFTGSWKFWSEGSPLTHYSEWSLMWIVVFAATVYFTSRLIFSKRSKSFMETALILFMVIYNCFLFIVPMFPRYLLLLFIPMVIFIGISVNTVIPYEKKE